MSYGQYKFAILDNFKKMKQLAQQSGLSDLYDQTVEEERQMRRTFNAFESGRY